jgi:hypothetical protein
MGVIVSVTPDDKEITYPHTFWFKPVSNFGLYLRDDVYRQFTFVGHVTLALAPLCLLLADSAFPHGSAYSFLRVLFRQLQTRQLLILHVSVGSAD